MIDKQEVIVVEDDEGNAPRRRQQKIREDLIKEHNEQNEQTKED